MREDRITVSLELPGLRVVKTIESEDRVEAVIETTVPVGCCPRCGHGTLRSKGRRDRILRDIPVMDKPPQLRWRRRAFGCQSCGHRFVERHESVPPRARATVRFEAYLYRRTRPGPVPLAHVARCERVSFYRVQTAHTKGAAGELVDRSQALRTFLSDGTGAPI